MHFGTDGKLYVGVGENADTAPTRRTSTTRTASCCASTTTAPSRPTTRSSPRRPGWRARSGRSGCATRSPSPCNRAPVASTSTTSGENSWEEINVGAAGANYGWPSSEGPDNVSGNIVGPLFAYKHSAASAAGSGPGGFFTGFSIAGGAFYPAAGGTGSPARSIATATTSPISWAASSGGSTWRTATRPTRSPASPIRRSTCSSASTARCTCWAARA